MSHFLNQNRYQYDKYELQDAEIKPDPVMQFQDWFDDVLETELLDPNAMHLSTVDKFNKPQNRVVLLKYFDRDGFVFFSNYNSSKAMDIASNPHVALTFYWRPLERQVRIEGIANRVDASISDAYFQTRPRDSQLSAWASPQSKQILDRTSLEDEAKRIENAFPNHIPRPDFWGGYCVSPMCYEFWQGRPNRSHDRIVYQHRKDDQWDIKRLAP
jgi:pyridoxamine 5'-phosphate oxidase